MRFQLTIINTSIEQHYSNLLDALTTWKNLQAVGVDSAYIIVCERSNDGWTRIDVPAYMRGLAKMLEPA